MSNGRQNAWPPQPHGNSAHSSPSNSATSNYGDFNNANSFQGLQPNSAAAAAARYNASVMGPTGYSQQPHPHQHQPHHHHHHHQQQQQYGGTNGNYYPQYEQGQAQVLPAQVQARPPPSHQMMQAQPMFTPNVNPYGYGGGSAAHGIDATPDNPYSNAWVSAVPNSFTPQDGSAFSKSGHYQTRDSNGQQSLKMDGYMQNSQLAGLPFQQQPQQSQLEPPQQTYLHQQSFKRDRGDEVEDDGDDNEEGDGDGSMKKKGQKGASEFVKKLFRMLDDTSYASIVSWGPTGDSFIVRDMNDFTKHVLPRHFRHSNFASFVRQLNKYDFHKVKKPDESGQPQPLGVDQQWEFRHPAFLQGREDMLEHVRRKVPTSKKTGRKDDDTSPRDQSPTMPGVADAAEKGAQDYTQLKETVATLTASQDQMTSHINNLTKQYQAVIGEMLTFQKNMVQQDQLMQNLIQYLMNLEADRKIEASAASAPAISASEDPSRPQLENSGAFVSTTDAEKLVSNFSDAAKGSFSQMSQLAQRAALGSTSGTPSSQSGVTTATSTAGTSFMRNEEEPLSPKSSQATPGVLLGQSPQTEGKGKERESSTDQSQPSMFFHPPHLEDDKTNDLFSAAANAVDNPSLAAFEDAGLRVFTVGTLQPRSESTTADPAALHSALSRDPPSAKSTHEADRPFGISVPSLEQLPARMPRVDGRSTSSNTTPKPGGEAEGHEPSTPSEGAANMLRVRRSTYVPGWAVPPKVLVVDDDDVCRKLGSKFLQVFGCAIDVAVDGVTAVNKMNLEKYDLVLMDIVMPNLDGVSATSLIREFDARTPIISMTSNSGPQELLSYMSSGMNDVLPKPFTKEGLLNMLEKHLIHLKTVQKMDEIPKALGLPPVSEDVMQGVLSATAASAQTLGGAISVASPGDGANPMAALMGNGPQVMRASQEAKDFTEDEEGLVNPLAGMGFSDEEYISMLQNLIAAGAVSDSARGETADSVANVMGVARGEGTSAASGSRSKESTPQGSKGSMLPPQAIGRKRSIDSANDTMETKKSRFTELPA